MFKYKFSVKGDISRSLIVRNNHIIKYYDHSYIYIRNNAGITIKKKSNPRSKFLYGPISRKLKRKKFISLYTYVI